MKNNQNIVGVLSCRMKALLALTLLTLLFAGQSRSVAQDLEPITITTPDGFIYYNTNFTGIAPTSPCGTFIVNFSADYCGAPGQTITLSPQVAPDNAFQYTEVVSNTFSGSGGQITASITWYCSNFTKLPTDIIFTCSATFYDPTAGTTTGGPVTNAAFDSGCSCGSSCSPGSGSGQNGCVDFTINLGAGNYFNKAGVILLAAETPSATLGTPAGLTVPVSPASVVTVLTNSSGIAQIVAPLGLFAVTNVASSQYQVQYFTNGSFTIAGGGYYTPGTNTPYITYVITNLYSSSNSDVLTITQEENGLSNRVFQYTYSNSGTNQSRWDMQQPDGTTLSKWYYAVTNNVTNVYWQTSAGTNILSQTCATSTYIPSASLVLTNQVVEGVGSVTQTNTYTYYATNAGAGSSNQLQRIDYPNGNWVFYQYDSSGRITNAFSAFGNSTPPALGVVPDVVSNQCKQTTYNFTPVSAIDDGTLQVFLPRTTTVILPATGATNGRAEVSRIYRTVASDYVEEEDCPNPGATNGTPGNVRTVTYNYDVSVGAPNAGRVESVSRPDGTATFYTYSMGGSTLTTEEDTGQPDDWEAPNSIVNGTSKITVTDQLGRIQSVTVSDIPSGYQLSSKSYNYSYLDPLGRDYTLTDNLSGLSTTYEYACCGLDSVTDPDGVITSYGYDLMNRVVTTTTLRGTNAITITSTYDGLGRVVETDRTGSDNTTMMQNQSAYDVLSRLIAATNALGGSSSITYAITNSQQMFTRTDPDNGTSVQLDYRDGTLQNETGTAVAPMRDTNFAQLDGGYYRQVQQQIQLDASANDTSNWTQTVIDGAGRTYKTIYASAGTNHPYTISYYSTDPNNTTIAGLMTNQVDPDGVSTLFVYNPKAELALTVLDVNQNSNIDWGGPDRIMLTTNYITTADYSNTNNRTDIYVWDSSLSSSNLLSTSETSVSGLNTWQTTYLNPSTPVTTHAQTVYSGGGSRSVTNIAPDSSYSVTAYSYGQLISITQYDSNNVQIGQVTNGYDAHGRLSIMTDARNGTTSNSFNNADQIVTTTTPAPSAGASPEVTISYYDSSERLVGTELPDGTYTTNYLNSTGQANQSFGSREYPVGYGYDSQQRMTTMTNWTDFLTDAGSRVTTWNYDQYRGWLASKQYADNTETVYSNTAAGWLSSRLWARGTNTSYTYNNAGDLATVVYNDGLTPGITNGYDRLGHKNAVTNSAAGATNVYTDAGLLLSQAYTTGPMTNWSVTNGYDSFMRRTNMVVLSNGTPVWTNIFSYDAASRLATVSDGVNSAGYSYVANSPLVSQITLKQSGTTRMTTTKQYDLLNRLTSIGTTNSSSVTIASSAYGYNLANQRTSMTNADGSYWLYGYDSLGQVISAVKYWSDGTPAPGEQFGNTFDDIGNRVNSQMGGNANGLGLRNANYTVNDLNQYTSRTVPGAVDILGAVTNSATVTVNDVLAYRHGTNYEATLPVGNAGSAVWQAVTNLAVLGGSTNTNATVTGSLFLPQNPETFIYDSDGNLLQDGRFTNTWDAENRLIGVTNIANIATAGKYALSFSYDDMGRRIQKVVYTNSIGTWVASYTNRFVYDGWNVVAILDAGNNVLYSFIWGCDLSGSIRGAGGVGGLVSMTVCSGIYAGTYFYAYDGNANVAAVVNASTGSSAAQYEYGPFGALIGESGLLANINRFLFSTKWYDTESELYYYGNRYYNPSIEKWENRDPLSALPDLQSKYVLLHDLGESVSRARTIAKADCQHPEYCFIGNNALLGYDFLGLCDNALIDSGPGVLKARLRHALPLPGRHKYAPSITRFSLYCPPDRPYLVQWSLEASGDVRYYFKEDTFPQGWTTYEISTLPPSYYFIDIETPSTVAFFKASEIPLLHISGVCSCIYSKPVRNDFPGPNQPTMDEPPDWGGFLN
jgi:RHS repeat-associated protein